MDESLGMIEVNLIKAVVEIPKNSISLNLVATIYENGEIRKVSNTLDIDEVRKSIKNAEDYYDDPEGTWVINEKYLEYLKSQEQKD